MKRLIISLIAGVVGIAALLAGLAWDAWLHAQDATLAQREGVFDLTNPGHALLGVGMALACGGIFSALHAAWGMAGPDGSGMASARLRNGALGGAALASFAAVAFALSASAAGHDHADETALAANGHAHAAGAPTGAGAADIAEQQAHTSAASAAMPAPAMDGAPPASSMQAPDTMPAEDLHADEMTGGAPPAADEMTQVIAGTSAEPAPAHAEGAQAHPAPAPAPVAAGGMPAAAGNAHADPVATAEEQACYKALTEEARLATLRFQDFAVAEAEGYRANPLKPEATHYANRVYSRDGAILDLGRPETLVYWTRDDGAKLLLGVLYKSPKGTSGPAPCGNATVWHTHTSCVDPATRAQIEDADGACPDGYRLQESGEMMHLWFVGKRSPL